MTRTPHLSSDPVPPDPPQLPDRFSLSTATTMFDSPRFSLTGYELTGQPSLFAPDKTIHHVRVVGPGYCKWCCRPAKSWGRAQPSKILDVPQDGRPVILQVHLRHLMCEACDKRFDERMPNLWENRRITRRLGLWLWARAGEPRKPLSHATGLFVSYISSFIAKERRNAEG